MGHRKGYQKIQSSFGQQIWDKDLRMGIEQWVHAGLYSLVMTIVAALVFCFAFIEPNTLWFVVRGLGAGFISSVAPSLPLPLDGQTISSYQLYQVSKEFGLFDKISSCVKVLLFSLPVGVATFFFMFGLYRRRADEIEVLKHLDGTELKTPSAVMARMKALDKSQPERRHVPTLPIGEAYLSYCTEVFGLLIIGAMGSGKTVIYSYILKAAEKLRGYKIFAYTVKGDFIEMFYQFSRGDIIFNAFDLRGLDLNVFSLVKNNTDFLRIACCMIPEPRGNAEPFWTTAARDCFAAMLNYCYMSDKRTNADVWEVLCLKREEILEKVAPLFGSEETLKYFSDPKLASNISAVIAGYTGIFKYLPAGNGANFDLKNWLESKEGGWIFVSNHEDVRDALKPWLTLFVDALVSAHLSLPDDYDRRVIYALDEINTLNSTIAETVHKLSITGRSKGAVTIAGGQGMGGFEQTFGDKRAQDICNALGNSIFLRTGADPKTAGWMSDVLGDTMFLEAEVSHSAKTGDGADGTTTRMVRKIEKLRLPSVFMNVLGSLEGYVRLAEYGVFHTTWKYIKFPKINDGFIPRPDINMEVIKFEYDALQLSLGKAVKELTDYEKKVNAEPQD